MTIHQNIGKITKEFMYKEPFYGLFLITLNKVVNNNIPTAGVSKNGINAQLGINEKYWESLSDRHKTGLLKHELLHIVLFHLFLRDDFADKEIFNIAADLEVNQYIDTNMLPEGALTLDRYPELNLKERAGTRYYYEEISKAIKNGTSPNLQELLDSLRGNGGLHPTWKEFEGSESERGLIRRQIDYQVKEIIENNRKSMGTIPAELAEYIDQLFKEKESVFNWKAYLRRFAGNSIKVYTKKSRRKLNRRFHSLPGLKIKTKKHILVAIDTSGSVSNEELVEFFVEIHNIWKTGCMVTVVECDASLHTIKEYKGKFDGVIHGRGGTSFQPVINYYDENKKLYNTCIYLTDGECSAPTKPRGSILWVISSKGRINEQLPGIQIKIP